MQIKTVDSLQKIVYHAIREQKITDIHTHLYPPAFGPLFRWGADELITYHFLVNEYIRWNEVSIEEFNQYSKEKQAEKIWHKLFLEHSPISEATRGVLTVFSQFGCDLASRNLDDYRRILAEAGSMEHLNKVRQLSNVEHIIMTNDPFDPKERDYWLKGVKPEANYHPSLRLDKLIKNYQNRKSDLISWGYQVTEEWNEQTISEIKRFLFDWVEIVNPLYFAVSLPPTFVYPDESDTTKIIRDCVLPVSLKTGIPFAMMIGTKTTPNHPLRNGAHVVGKSGISSLVTMLASHPDNRFIVSMLSREDQHELTVLARKFNNVMIFGCWWFLNNPVFINEIVRMQIEMIGPTVIPIHSDAQSITQLIYKWNHPKEQISAILYEKYAEILKSGWVIEEDEIKRDVADLFHNNFWRFIGKTNMLM